MQLVIEAGNNKEYEIENIWDSLVYDKNLEIR